MITSRGDFAYTKVFYIPPNKQTKEQRETNMKIRNLAFCGVMASILSGWGALAADGDTIIASKAYVDAMDATKQNKLNSGDGGNITVSGTGNVVTGITASNGAVTVTKGNIAATDFVKNTDTVNNETKTNVLEFDNDANHAPSITAVKNMKTTSVRTTGAVDTLVPTEAAVRSAITSATSTLNTNIETTASGITGQFESTVADDGSGTIIAEDTGEAPDNVVVDADHPNLIPRNYNIQQGIAYLEGTGIENHNKTNTDGVGEDEIANTDSAWGTIIGAKAADDYVPTIAAVEKRVLAAETTASGNYANRNLSNLNPAGNTVIDGRIDTKINALDATGVDGSSDAATTANRGKPVVAISQADGVISAELGQVKEAGIEDSAVTSAKIADGTIVNADISSSAAIDFSKMNAGLSSVNVAGSTYNSSCTASNPCVLTYFDGKYEWTAMDTENVSAVN